MNEFFASLMPLLLRATILLLLGGLVVGSALRRLQPRSVGIHRAAWCCVLLNGLLLAPLTLQVPLLESHERLPETVVEAPSEVSLVLPDDIGRSGALSGGHLNTPIAENWHEGPPPQFGWPMVLQIAGWIWMTGVLASFCWGATSWLLLQRVLARARPVSWRFQAEADQLIEEADRRTRLPLLAHRRLGPMLCLTWRGSRIVVPTDVWAGLSTSERASVLRHEFAHWRRGDVWKSLAVRLLAIPHWFNPMAWRAIRRFEEAAEWASDDTLAQRHPEEVPAFANVLLQLAERRTPLPVGISAAQGAPLCTRLQRLLTNDQSPEKDAVMKRALILALLGVVAVIGVFRLELVAQEADEREAESEATEFDEFRQWQQHADGFSGRLVVSDDPLLQEFRDSLQSQPGQIVLHDRADRASAEVIEEAQVNVIPDWFADHFVEQGGRFEPRPEDEEFHARLVSVAQTVDEDLTAISEVFRREAPRVRQESEIERLFVRFMNSEAAAVMIYAQELQRVLRPDLNLLLEATNGIFVRRGDGRIEIHPGRRDDAGRFLEIVRGVTEGLPLLEAELQDWSLEMATPDEFHQQVKDALGDPLFSAFIVREALEGETSRRPITQRVEGFFQELEEITVETAEGLQVREQYRDELQHGLDEFERARRGMDSLRSPFDELAELLVADDELHRGWQEILRSTPLRMRIAAEIGPAGAGPAMVAEAILGEVLAEGDDGQLHLSHEDPQEVQEFVENMFAEYRTLRRRWRLFDTYSHRVDNEEIAAALQTTGGRLFVTRELQRQIQQLSADGLAMWVSEHFSETPEGLALNADSREVIEDFMADVEGLIRELENDDFTNDGRQDDDRERDADDRG